MRERREGNNYCVHSVQVLSLYQEKLLPMDSFNVFCQVTGNAGQSPLILTPEMSCSDCGHFK